VTVQLYEETDSSNSRATTGSVLMPATMTELRWILTVVSIGLTVQFAPVECVNNTTGAGKHEFQRSRDNAVGIMQSV
jgi:hypothetical protein